MRLGALEKAAGAIWNSMLGITYTLQLKIFLALRLCGTTRLHELKVWFVFRLWIQWWLRPLKENWTLVKFQVWKVWNWSSLIHQHSISLTLPIVWFGTYSLSFLQRDLWVAAQRIRSSRPHEVLEVESHDWIDRLSGVFSEPPEVIQCESFLNLWKSKKVWN